MTSQLSSLSPSVRFFAGRSETFIESDTGWRHMSPEDEARSRTGLDRETHEPNIGIHVVRRPNGLVRIGFDLWKLDVNLRLATVENLESRWREQAARFSKPLLRSVSRRAHFSKSFAQFEVAPEELEGWKHELESVLSSVDSFEPIEARITENV
jgi:hypothetical protein